MLDPILISDPVTRFRTGINALIGDKPLDAAPVLDVGISGQVRAGRQLTVADFTTLLGVSTPVGLFNLGSLTNLGTGGNLVNKGAVTFGPGIAGAASEAAAFTGSTAQALYIADTGAADPFRLGTGSWGCWFRVGTLFTSEFLLAKSGPSAPTVSIQIGVDSSGKVSAGGSANGSSSIFSDVGTSNTRDGRWHHTVVTYDGSSAKIYVDGQLETTIAAAGKLFASSGPVNIGGIGADAGTAAYLPSFGAVDEAFFLADVLDLDQVRMLYAAKVPHALPTLPEDIELSVRRRRKGPALVSADCPAQPVRLHSFAAGALTDQGSGAVSLTNNNAAVVAPGVDGTPGNAFQFAAGSSQSLSSADTGLPTGATTRTFGCWFNIAAPAGVSLPLLAYGSTATGPLLYAVATTGTLALSDGASNYDTTVPVCDGKWHFALVVSDNSAVDGRKIKVYLDGALIYSTTTTQGTATLLGAGGFRIGRNRDAGTTYLTGIVANVLIAATAYTPSQVGALYAKGSHALPSSPKNVGDHVEAVTDANIYVVCDTLPSQHQIDLRVAA